MQDAHNCEKQVVSAVRSFAESINLGSKISYDMSMLVDATNKLPLSNLDYWERLIRSEFYNTLTPSKKSNWKFWVRSHQILTWLDLISWDGYKREKTLRTLTGAAPNSFFFALALRRLNDWVPQVREAAIENLPLIVEKSTAEDIVEAICITVSHWGSWGRIEQSGKDVLLQIISKQEIGSALKNKIICSSSGPMSSLMAQVGRTSVLDNYLSEIAENAIQPSVRAKAYRSQFEGRITWLEGRKFEWTDIRYCEGKVKPIIGERSISTSASFRELLEKSAIDPSSIVRRIAAEFFIRELRNIGDDSLQLANLFAADKSSAVSERGKFTLRKLQEHA